MWYWILGLYFVPMVVNIVFQYYEENVEMQTVGDLLKTWYFYFVPIFNILITFLIPFYYIDKIWSYKLGFWWERFKNIKIR